MHRLGGSRRLAGGSSSFFFVLGGGGGGWGWGIRVLGGLGLCGFRLSGSSRCLGLWGLGVVRGRKVFLVVRGLCCLNCLLISVCIGFSILYPAQRCV